MNIFVFHHSWNHEFKPLPATKSLTTDTLLLGPLGLRLWHGVRSWDTLGGDQKFQRLILPRQLHESVTMLGLTDD